MKIFHRFTVLIILLGFSGISAQKALLTPDELAGLYSDYFSLDREAIFLHLNKTEVAMEENIWFSAYSYNPRVSLPGTTTNLHVNLYNREGKLLRAKVIYMESGKGAGYFKLDSGDYPPGDYFIRAFTKYMENFNEDGTYIQTFRILGEIPEVPTQRKFDLQLLASGGHLVSNVKNTVGVKLIDHTGMGVRFAGGKVLDEKNTVVNSFRSNQLGLSKFSFTPEAGIQYHVVIQLENGKEIREKVPPAEEKGLVISGIAMKDKVLFAIRTNEETYNSLGEYNEFLFSFHKDGAMKALSFSIPRQNLEANITLTKEALFPGINTITIFNHRMEPVLERLVFNRKGIARKKISADFIGRNSDSLVINLSSADSLGLHSLSVSVLPQETLAYNPDHNILAAFYLKPYLRGNLEDGSHYFSREISLRRRNYDLDLLLLTQGWSRYSWENIFREPPKEIFGHERGFTMSGTVMNRNEKKETRLYIGSASNGFSAIIDLDQDGSFRIENAFLRDSTMVSFSLLNNRNDKISKPSVSVRIFPEKDREDTEDFTTEEVVIPENPGDAFPEKFISGAEELKAIVLKSEERSPAEENLLEERELNRSAAFGRTYVISENEVRTHPQIRTLLRTMGFVVKGKRLYSQRELMRHPLGLSNFGLPAQPAAVFINGSLQVDLSFLVRLYTRDIHSIYTSKTTRGPAAYLAGPGGVVKIITKNPQSGVAEDRTRSVILSNGFSINKEFYAPKYRSYSHSLFENYGVIDWFPRVRLREGEKTLKILNTMQDGVKLFIEGITDQGALISEVILSGTR